jgi:hypothetical protein
MPIFRTLRIQRRTRIRRHPQRSARRTRATSITAPPASYILTDRHTVACQRFEEEMSQDKFHVLRRRYAFHWLFSHDVLIPLFSTLGSYFS